MGVFDKIMGKGEEVEVSSEDEFYSMSVQEAYKDNNSEGNKMILLEPRAYSESQQIADYLKKKTSVIVNLKRVTPDQGKRIVDFLSGTLYAIEGDLQKLGGGIFLCTPHGMNVDGIFSDDNQKGQAKGAAKSDKDEKEDDEFNW